MNIRIDKFRMHVISRKHYRKKSSRNVYYNPKKYIQFSIKIKCSLPMLIKKYIEIYGISKDVIQHGVLFYQNLGYIKTYE